MRMIGTALLLAAGVIACYPSSDAPAVLTAEDEAAIHTLIEEWDNSWVPGDLQATVALYADDYVEARPTAIVGRQAVLDIYGTYTNSYTSFNSTVRRLEGVGNLAYAWVSFEAYYTREDGERRIQVGNGIWVFKKDAEGQWRFAASGWQTGSTPDSTEM